MEEDYLVESAALGTSYWIYFLIGGLILVVILVLIFGIWRLKRYLTRPDLMGMSREEIRRRWDELRKTSESNGLMGAKLALLEADNLLDSGLKSLMMPGETLGERLKVACYKYPKLKNVWWAHKLRNQLAHESSFQISPRQARQALDEFEKALKILNIL